MASPDDYSIPPWSEPGVGMSKRIDVASPPYKQPAIFTRRDGTLFGEPEPRQPGG
jgi:hypothetical protein